MNYLQRSFQISFALHALVVLLLIFMGDRFISSGKILVIDFTLEDTAGGDNAGNRAGTKTRLQKRDALRKALNKRNAGAAEAPVQAVPQAMPQVIQNSGPSPTVAIEGADSVHSEPIATSAIGAQESADKSITRMSSAPVAAADRNTTPGRDADTVDDARGIKYLKANYSYIVQLIHRHLTYPKTAWQMGWQGKVRISFFVSSDGDAEGIRIVESSGIAAVDRSALEAVKRASPFPKPPAEARISIPISYRLR